MSNHKRNSHELLWMEAGASYSKKKTASKHVSNEKKGPRLFRVYGGDYTTQSYRDDIKPI